MLLMLPNTPAEEASNTCDWGNCDELTTSWRWGGPQLAKWIPVCHEHRAKTQAERVQELADEFRRLAADRYAEAQAWAAGRVGSDRTVSMALHARGQTWEQAAQMLEERLNG